MSSGFSEEICSTLLWSFRAKSAEGLGREGHGDGHGLKTSSCVSRRYISPAWQYISTSGLNVCKAFPSQKEEAVCRRTAATALRDRRTNEGEQLRTLSNTPGY